MKREYLISYHWAYDGTNTWGVGSVDISREDEISSKDIQEITDIIITSFFSNDITGDLELTITNIIRLPI